MGWSCPKCSFSQPQIEYLVHIITKHGVTTNSNKTVVMMKWLVSTIVTELRAFLGLTSYYRRFVKHYGLIAKPLTNLLSKNHFIWDCKAHRASEQLKRTMVSTPVLALPKFKKPLK